MAYNTGQGTNLSYRVQIAWHVLVVVHSTAATCPATCTVMGKSMSCADSIC